MFRPKQIEFRKYKIKKFFMRKDLIVVALLAIGIGWAAWMDWKRVDPDWKDDECHKGISYSVHQRESDESWVIGVRNRYLERLAVSFSIRHDGKSEVRTGLLRKGEKAFFMLPGENPEAEISGVYFADEDGNIIEEMPCE